MEDAPAPIRFQSKMEWSELFADKCILSCYDGWYIQMGIYVMGLFNAGIDN